MIINEDGQEEEVDFDICEMCLKWAIYCTRKGRGNLDRVAQIMQEDDTVSLKSEEDNSALTKMPLVGAVKSKTNFEWPNQG